MTEKNKVCDECGKHIIENGHLDFVLRVGVGDWSAYKIIENGAGGLKCARCNPLWKHWYYKLRDVKRLLLNQYEDKEFWVCDACWKEAVDSLGERTHLFLVRKRHRR